jgi:hypothetical protein
VSPFLFPEHHIHFRGSHINPTEVIRLDLKKKFHQISQILSWKFYFKVLPLFWVLDDKILPSWAATILVNGC